MDVDPPFDPMLDGGGLDDLAPPYVPPAPSPELAGPDGTPAAAQDACASEPPAAGPQSVGAAPAGHANEPDVVGAAAQARCRSARPSLLRPGTALPASWRALTALMAPASSSVVQQARCQGCGSLSESPWQARGRGSKGRKRSGGPVMDEELAISKKVLVSSAWCMPDGVTARLSMHAMTCALRAIGRRRTPYRLSPS